VLSHDLTFPKSQHVHIAEQDSQPSSGGKILGSLWPVLFYTLFSRRIILTFYWPHSSCCCCIYNFLKNFAAHLHSLWESYLLVKSYPTSLLHTTLSLPQVSTGPLRETYHKRFTEILLFYSEELCSRYLIYFHFIYKVQITPTQIYYLDIPTEIPSLYRAQRNS
jgi:hypothetical protein